MMSLFRATRQQNSVGRRAAQRFLRPQEASFEAASQRLRTRKDEAAWQLHKSFLARKPLELLKMDSNGSPQSSPA